jgi:hypothetical protein
MTAIQATKIDQVMRNWSSKYPAPRIQSAHPATSDPKLVPEISPVFQPEASSHKTDTIPLVNLTAAPVVETEQESVSPLSAARGYLGQITQPADDISNSDLKDTYYDLEILRTILFGSNLSHIEKVLDELVTVIEDQEKRVLSRERLLMGQIAKLEAELKTCNAKHRQFEIKLADQVGSVDR